MKIVSLALASTFAVAVFSAQPVLAQNQNGPDSSNAASSENGAGMNNNDATAGSEAQSDAENRLGRNAQGSSGPHAGGMAWRHGGRFSQDDRRDMRRRMMERHHQMMMGAMRGARIRLSRGNARIDVECPPRADIKACVDAAAELLDKVAGLHRGAEQEGATSGSAVTPPTSGSDENGQAPDTNNEDQDQNLDTSPMPNTPGERM
jgi:hypothetical protein